MNGSAKLAAQVAAVLTALATVGAAVAQVAEVVRPTKVGAGACGAAIETLSVQLSECLQGTKCD